MSDKVMISIECTAEERAVIEKAASNVGMSISEYILSAVRGGAPMVQYSELIRELLER